MYAAVWWPQERTWSVIEVSTIVSGDVVEGNFVYALHKNSPFEAKILRLSDNFNDLKSIKVHSDGTLQLDKALLPDVDISKKMKKQQKSNRSATTSIKEHTTAGPSDLTPVYTTTSSEPDSNVTITSTPSPSRTMPSATPEVLHYLRSLVAWLEADQVTTGPPESFACMPAAHAQQQGPPKRTEQQRRTDTSAQKPELTVCTEQPRHYATAWKDGSNFTSSGEEELPFPLPPIADPTLLYIGHNVEISKSLRSSLLKKYPENPEGMTRQLAIHLVGIENLKIMRPRQHGESMFRPIPVRIMRAIDDFVLNNTKLTTFTKSELTKVVSNFINKLRTPNREHVKKGKKNDVEELAPSQYSQPRTSTPTNENYGTEIKGRKRMECRDSARSLESYDAESKSTQRKAARSHAYRSPSKVINSPSQTIPNTRVSPSNLPMSTASSATRAVTCPSNSPWKVNPWPEQHYYRPVIRNLFGLEGEPYHNSSSQMICDSSILHTMSQPDLPYGNYLEL